MNRTVALTPHLRRAGLVVCIASLAAIGFATLIPQPGKAVDSHFCLVCGSLGGVSAVLNILLFVPLGIGLAISGFSRWRAILLVFAVSALIEIAQLLVIPGRNATIGDVLTNTVGGAIGFTIARTAFGLLRPSSRSAMFLTIGWSTLWLLIQTISAFGFSPSLPRSRYYGQIARQLGNSEPFSGHVLCASIGDVVVPDAEFDDSPRVRQLLIGGAAVTTSFLPPSLEHESAAIVRVADEDEREILLLSQNASDIVFGIRTGAAALRLRPPLFALPGVFAAVPSDGTATNAITVSAAYSSREAWMNAQSANSDSRRVPINATLGWTMLMPFQWFIEGSRVELGITFLWTACLLLPIGYWLACAIRFPRGHDAAVVRITATTIAFGFVLIGLIAVPQAFGLPPASPIDWLAALAGILSGVLLAPRASAPIPDVVGEASLS